MKATKRTLTVLLAALMIFGLLVPGVLATPVTPAPIASIFLDPALATAIADELGVPVTTVVNQGDLDTITDLHLNSLGIQDLEGMQYLSYLINLSLTDNPITDLSPLTGLPDLWRLYIMDTPISDIGPLATLPSLEILWGHGALINDLTPLAGLTNMDMLFLSDNEISDVTPLAGLTNLTTLSLSGNQISDLSPLAGLISLANLDSLNVSGQEITLPSVPLADPLLVANDVFLPDGSPVLATSISNGGTPTPPSVTWTGLPATVTEVSYQFNETFSVLWGTGTFSGTVTQPLSALPAPIASIFPDPVLAEAIAWEFENQVGLTGVLPSPVTVSTVVTQDDLNLVAGIGYSHRLVGYGIVSLEGLQFMPNLSFLGLGGNEIVDITPIAGLTDLTVLYLYDNQIADITPLTNLTDLILLWLTNNEITDITPLTNLTDIDSLTLGRNQITDISPLAGLVRLDAIALENNQISDFRPLDGLPLLVWISATGQEITLLSRTIANPLAVENAVFLPDGSRMTPSWISNSGTYTTPNVTWTGLPNTVTEVSYMFSATSPIGEFSGTVRQPLTPATVQPPNNGGGGSTPPPPPQPDPDPEYRFLDVNSGHWFYDAVMFVYEQGIMQGTSTTVFSPDATLSRGMVATILWRLDGEPVSTASHSFGDVAAGTWYANAVAWAFENGIVQGVSATRFAPSDPITREQFATMLHRYAEFAGVDISVSAGASLDHFVDAYRTSDWAEDAKLWANYNELITGRTATTIVPGGTAQRAEAATILMRFIQNF